MGSLPECVSATAAIPQTVCPSLEEATHPRCCGEGYPDRPGRASSKEGDLRCNPPKKDHQQDIIVQQRGRDHRQGNSRAIYVADHMIDARPQTETAPDEQTEMR